MGTRILLAVLFATVALVGIAFVSWKAALIVGGAAGCATVVVVDFDPDEVE